MNDLKRRITKLEGVIGPLTGNPVETPIEAQRQAMTVLQAGFTSERLDQWLDPGRKAPMSLTRREAESWARARSIIEEATGEAE